MQLGREQGRVVLTRDRKLAGRRDAALCYFIRNEDSRQGFQEIVQDFGLSFSPQAFLARYVIVEQVCVHVRIPLLRLAARGSITRILPQSSNALASNAQAS